MFINFFLFMFGAVYGPSFRVEGRGFKLGRFF